MLAHMIVMHLPIFREREAKNIQSALCESAVTAAHLYLYYLNNPNKLFSYDEYHWENHKAVVLLPVMLLPWIMAIAAVFLLKIEIPDI